MGLPIFVIITFRSELSSGIDPQDLETMHWNDFEDAILCCSPEIGYTIEAEEPLFKWILSSVLLGKIMTRVLAAGRLELVHVPCLIGPVPDDSIKNPQITALPHHYTNYEIASIPKSYINDDCEITLDVAERVEWLMRPPHERELYLGSLQLKVTVTGENRGD